MAKASLLVRSALANILFQAVFWVAFFSLVVKSRVFKTLVKCFWINWRSCLLAGVMLSIEDSLEDCWCSS